MLKLILAGLIAVALFSAAKDITDCDANILSTNDLPPTLHVVKLAKHVEPTVKSIMEPSEDILMFKIVSYRFQTMKNGGNLYYVKVKYGYLNMYVHLRIVESADGVINLTGIIKNKSTENPISCFDPNLGKGNEGKNATILVNDTSVKPTENKVCSYINLLFGKGEEHFVKVVDEWQRNQEKNELCQCEKESNTGISTPTNPLTESYSTEDISAIRKKITEMAESTWNRFLQSARDPATPQIKVTFTENIHVNWVPWPLEWEVSKLVNQWGGEVYSRNGFWCSGATLVTALDSFTIMNLTKPTEAGKTWISTKLSSAINEGDLMNVKRHIPTYIGALLSNYFLTSNILYKDLSIQLGHKLLKAYSSKPNGLPNNWYHTNTLKSEAVPVYDVSSPYSALNIEFLYLSSISGNQEFRKNVQRILKTARMYASEDSLKPKGMFRNTGTLPFWEKTGSIWPEITAQSGGNYLDFLFKSWMMGNREDNQLRNELIQVTDTFIQDFVKRKGQITYVSVLSDDEAIKTEKNKHGMALSTCYTGGLFALIGASLGEPYRKKYLAIGEKIVTTCRKVHTSRSEVVSYDYQKKLLSGLPSELFFITDTEDVFTQKIIHAGGYRNTGETAESYFILWRLTHNMKYRKWGWELAKSIFKSTNGATNPIEGTATGGSGFDGYQHQALLSETFKYLYLLFCDDDVFPLDKWIFNANGHPLPIKGTLASF